MRVLLFMLSLVCAAGAHSLVVSPSVAEPAVVVRCNYDGGIPAAYASALVYAPGETKIEYQHGRTDAGGVFSFVPNAPGVWRLIVDDEEGHRREAQIECGPSSRPAPPPARRSVWQSLLTGLSLIAGLSGVLYGRSRRNV
jgi:nickel transport protein